ncbi:hypothetical protein E3N88_14560 [Mikania micrantha]|uniref:Ubiquitin-like domain-containing protein n=1 Tax=Mikania micrantha TaxID=192012 RepID=A0A5N6P1R8_9ASTR|nr:hypothetical protein E3N88_14560 [Mikania micrantha]
MADLDKYSGSRKRNGDGDGDGDDRSRNRIRKGRRLLEFFNSDFEVEENASSDVENNNKSLIKTTGKIILLIVKGSDTIGSIKLKIQAQESIPFDEQELIFNGMVLEDINTIDSMQIKNSTLKLVRKSMGLMPISIKHHQEKRMYCLEAKPTETIADVKDKIKIKEGIRVDEQVLIFNEMILGDDGTLFDFHIHAKSILTLMHKSRGFMQILIKTPTEETVTLEVKPSYTIYSIKRKIKDQVHIPCEEQELSFDEKVLRNINTLSDFNINKGSTLTLTRISCRYMQIFIKTLTETTFTLDVRRKDTIMRIKTRIQDNVDIHKVTSKEMPEISYEGPQTPHTPNFTEANSVGWDLNPLPANNSSKLRALGVEAGKHPGRVSPNRGKVGTPPPRKWGGVNRELITD